MFGEKALELIKELHRNKDGAMPAYNEDLVRQVLEEMQVLYDSNQKDVADLADADSDQSKMASVKMRHAGLERNKRCLLAYLYNRLHKIRQMRWEFGSILPPEVRVNMSEKEIQYFNKYNRSLANYMRSIGGSGGLDLTQMQGPLSLSYFYATDSSLPPILMLHDMIPPKSLYIEVRCIEDHGEYEMEDGTILLLHKNTQHFLPRSQCEHLIRQGILQHIM